MKPVYVALLNYNGSRDTIECLESLLRSDYGNLRILVLDQCSADGSLDTLQAWADGRTPSPDPASEAMRRFSTPPVSKPIATARVTRQDLEAGADIDWGRSRLALVDCGANLGFSGGNNVAFRYVLGRERDALLFMLNNDTVIAPGAISAMVAGAEPAGTGAVGATLLRYHAPDQLETRAGATVRTWTGESRLIGWGTPAAAPRDQPARMDFLSGCCMLIPHAALRQVGLIDERFFIYCEDADWGLRARSAGLRLAYCPSAEVWHKAGGVMVHRSAFHDYHTVKSMLHFARKHRPYLFPLGGAYLALRVFAPKVMRGEWGRLRAAFRGAADFAREVRRGAVIGGSGLEPAAKRVGGILHSRKGTTD